MVKNAETKKKKVNNNKVMKKTKLELEEINDQEEVYFNSDSESNKENIKSKTNQSNNSNQQRASCDNQSNNQIYQDSSQSPKQKEDNQSELDEEILSEESLAMKKRKKKSKNSSDALVTKPISKKNNQKYKNRLNKQRGDQCFFAKKDDDHHHNEQLINENIQITQKNIQDVIDKAKYYFNEIFNSKFFEEVAQLASYSIFEQNYKIDSEDIKKFTAFLLCTSNHKIDSISNYFNNPFLNISDIIPIQLFFFISSCLAARTQNLHELSKLLLKQIDQSLIMDSSFLGFQLELSKDNPNLIKSNCLDFFNDFIFDYFHKKILINPSYYQKNQPFFSDKSSLLFFSTNPRFRSINIYYQQEKKVSFKLLRDQILEQKLIFNNEATQLKCSPNSLPDLLYNQQINKLKEEQEEKEEISQNKNDSKEETQKCFFYYNPSTLQLVSIQVELIREKTSNSKHSKSKQNKKISTQEVYQIESTNLNPSIIQNIVFQDNNNAIQTKLLKIYNDHRPLTQINLEEMESVQLRAYSESIYSMCIQIFQKIILDDFKQYISQFNQNYDLLRNVFKYVLNQFIQSLCVIKKKQNFQAEIIVQRHSLQKKKHCNFCLVCKYYIENKEESKTNDESKNEDQAMLNEQEQKKKKSKYECTICSQYYKRTISVCVENCDEEFHKNPQKFLVGRSKKKKYLNVENLIYKIDNIKVSKTLEELDQTEKIVEEVIKKIQHDRLIAIDSINKPKNELKNKKNRKKYEYKNSNQINSINPNEIIDKILFTLPDQSDPSNQEELEENHNSQNESEEQDNQLRQNFKQEEQSLLGQVILNFCQTQKIENVQFDNQITVKQERND